MGYTIQMLTRQRLISNTWQNLSEYKNIQRLWAVDYCTRIDTNKRGLWTGSIVYTYIHNGSVREQQLWWTVVAFEPGASYHIFYVWSVHFFKETSMAAAAAASHFQSCAVVPTLTSHIPLASLLLRPLAYSVHNNLQLHTFQGVHLHTFQSVPSSAKE
ncbi:hypothetical protein O6H91_02G101200 [Diphasiastrum complanatum]|uniref:Uncharacterized protein n=1 Tax=Diphasiastrum complanatum TaxID=34168 RepID=A0ACC2EIU2_DIPCM|nr:hypothetical protein O6H91_02G101200 [Diphasiastrum complanatum]